MLSPWRLATAALLAALIPMTAPGAEPRAGAVKPTVMTLHRDQPGDVDLQTNASTGYSWKVDAPRGVEVTLVKTVPTRPGMVGAPSVVTYRIVGTKRGIYRIVFRYMRPWERKAVRTLVYRVRIV
jgi:predicted secreted protein